MRIKSSDTYLIYNNYAVKILTINKDSIYIETLQLDKKRTYLTNLSAKTFKGIEKDMLKISNEYYELIKNGHM